MEILLKIELSIINELKEVQLVKQKSERNKGYQSHIY